MITVTVVVQMCSVCCSGVFHLYGGGGAEVEPGRPQVRHPVLLLSHLLSVLHPSVALHQKLQQQDH